MPIYVYKCTSCGESVELIQSVGADAPDVCDKCGARQTMKKSVTSAAFVLKGSGWYATDFKGNGSSCSSCATSGCSTCGDSSSKSSKKESKEPASDAASSSKESPKSDAKEASAAPVPLHSS